MGVSMQCQCLHVRFLIGSPVRPHTMTNIRLESLDKQSFQLGLIVYLFTTEHFRPECVRVDHRGDTSALDERMNVGDGDGDHFIRCVFGEHMFYYLCVDEQLSILAVQF